MHIRYTILCLCLLLAACRSANYPQLEAEESRWQLLWQDEFDYTGPPDESKWSYDVGGHGWGNGELQYYTEADPLNVWVEHGVLTIQAKKAEDQLAPDTWAFYKDYTSARLTTKGKAAWTYGRFEIRAKLPRGRGLWPAVWMLSNDDRYGGWPGSGEIDIMEHVGFEETLTHNAIHTGDYNHIRSTHKVADNVVEAPYDTFHTYALEWHPDRLDFFVDDRLTMTFENSQSDRTQEWPYDHPFYLILNIAVGGNWGGQQGIDDNIFPAQMKIDFVRVFQLRDTRP